MMMWTSACHFIVILTLSFDIYFTKGIKWITEPVPVNKCKGQTANLTWEYSEEPGEEITQLQWIFNRTELIAYSSMNQGFNVEPRYLGRVKQSGETGILLYNISTKDTGIYTLYPLIKWEVRPDLQSVQLNVIEAALEPDCSCTSLSVIPEERNGQTYRIVVGSCNLEINSSVCCPVGLSIQYCVNDPSKLCAPIRNPNKVTESTTQSRIMNQERDSAGNEQLNTILHIQHIIFIVVLVISALCVTIVLMIILIHRSKIYLQMKSRKLKKKSTSEKVELEDAQESQSLQGQDV